MAKRAPPDVEVVPYGFIGRRRELAQLDALEADHRLITILGPAGIGKTTLARRWAQRKKRPVPFVDLSAARTIEDTVRLTAAAVGGALPAAGSLEQLTERVGRDVARAEHPLIVLDNLEQLVPIADRFLLPWLKAAPGTVWLCTSRHRLQIAGERSLELGGLDLPDAVSLFAARAKEAAPELDVGAESDAMQELVRRLDRVPLALELAASRTRELTVRELLEGVEEQLARALLRTETRGITERHRSLEAALDWSWALLSPDMRASVEKLAVFRGGFSPGAAAVVLGTPERAADLPEAALVIRELRDRSLIRSWSADGERRHALYESVVEHAKSRATDPSRLAQATELHVRYYATEAPARARALAGRDRRRAVSWLAREADNLHAAHRVALELDPTSAVHIMVGLDGLLVTSGPHELLLPLLDRTVAVMDEAPVADRIELLLLRGRARFMRGWFPLSLEDHQLAYALADSAARPELLSDACYGLSGTRRRLGDARGSVDEARRALELARAAGDRLRAAKALFQLGGAWIDLHETERALAVLRDALPIAREEGASRLESMAQFYLGVAMAELGDHEAAAVWYERALALAEEIRDPNVGGKILARWIELRTGQCQLEDAERLLERAEALALEVCDRELEVACAIHGARIARARGRSGAARVSLERALAEARHLGAPLLAAAAESALSELTRGERPIALVVESSGMWFEPPRGDRVDLARRVPLRRLLSHLSARRRSTPGAAIGAVELIEVGWPGEKVSIDSGAERVYAAVRALRRLGLGSLLLTRDGGYLLDPSVPIESA